MVDQSDPFYRLSFDDAVGSFFRCFFGFLTKQYQNDIMRNTIIDFVVRTAATTTSSSINVVCPAAASTYSARRCCIDDIHHCYKARPIWPDSGRSGWVQADLAGFRPIWPDAKHGVFTRCHLRSVGRAHRTVRGIGQSSSHQCHQGSHMFIAT